MNTEDGNVILKTQSDWDQKWVQHFDHYQNDLRHAYYIDAVRRKKEQHLLEIAAGSFRDMAKLSGRGISCDGVDYSGESVARAKKRYPDLSQNIFQMDAKKMSFGDKEYDLTYHNGFWGLFSDDEICELAGEQARITKYRMIATVHNAHNTSFREYFNEMSKKDPLYQIRFFPVDEIRELMLTVCSSVTIVPVGKGKKKHEDLLIRYGFGHPLILKTYFDLSRNRLLDHSERLMCIGEF
jgi:hypothetical protein